MTIRFGNPKICHRAIATACCVIICGCHTPSEDQAEPPMAPGQVAQPAPPPDQQLAAPPIRGAETCEGRPGTGLADAFHWNSLWRKRAAAAIDCDAYAIMQHVWALRLSKSRTDEIYTRVLELRRESLSSVAADPMNSARLPLSAAHQKMYEAAAEAEREAGYDRLLVWSTNRWKPIDPLELPNAQTSHNEPLTLALLRGEKRAITFNLRNNDTSARRVRISTDMPGLPATIETYRVSWTGNDLATWTAAELSPLEETTQTGELLLLPGVTQQVWLAIATTADGTPGTYTGDVQVLSEDLPTRHLQLQIDVFTSRAPSQRSLHLGGWDYTDGPVRPRYAVTDENRRELVSHLRVRNVDIPWSLRGEQMFDWSMLDANGNLRHPIDPQSLKDWIDRWPNAYRYRVHLSVRSGIAGIPETDGRFFHAVSTWARAWAAEVYKLGLRPDQFEFLFVDEPDSIEDANRATLWARALQESAAGFRVWTDPIFDNPYAVPQQLIEFADTISINVSFAERAPAYWEWARQLQARGKTIELYACEGPARRLDPYGYYRLGAWRAFLAGAAGISYWSFSDHNGVPADNEFAMPETPRDYNYSPLFVGSNHVRPGKHMEAIAEGIEDTFYLQLLNEVATTSSSPSTRSQAQALLEEAKEFLRLSTPTGTAKWSAQQENSRADVLREKFGRFLDSLNDV